MESILLFILEILGNVLMACLEVFGEVALQVVLEALAEAGSHLLGGRAGTQASRGLLMLGYALLGAVVGGLSLLVFPHSLAHGHGARLASLLLAPLLATASTVALGRLRQRRPGHTPVALDRAAYAYLFALALGAVRYVGAA